MKWKKLYLTEKNYIWVWIFLFLEKKRTLNYYRGMEVDWGFKTYFHVRENLHIIRWSNHVDWNIFCISIFLTPKVCQVIKWLVSVLECSVVSDNNYIISFHFDWRGLTASCVTPQLISLTEQKTELTKTNRETNFSYLLLSPIECKVWR